MHKNTLKDFLFFLSIIQSVALIIAIMKMDSNFSDYKNYQECTRYAEKQTCFEKTLKGKQD